MAEWSPPHLNCLITQFDYQFATYPPRSQDKAMHPPPPPPGIPQCQPPPLPPQAQPCNSQHPNMAVQLQQYGNPPVIPKGDSPREIRNRAEKMRRDRLNQSVKELAAMVPPVLAARRKIDKTTILRLTAHYLRAHQYVFGDSIGQSGNDFSPAAMLKVLGLFNGFLITVTYRGIIVVVSQNVHQYLGYTELDLLGQNLLNITHEDDCAMLKDQLMPKTQNFGPNGELLIPDEPGAKCKVEEALAREKRRFVVRFRKLGQRSEPCEYITCHVEGSLRKSDRACGGFNRCCQIVRRVRARTENPCSSGNDIVFIGIVRPTSETFINESALESYRMEYRTRHAVDGQIIQCESRIALVTGYMKHEVNGVNAMNFMHKDDVRWVIFALREMYDQHRIFGESCYRLMTKNGQFIYMKTRGRLDVDENSRACTSFVCTNTVVDENEGKHLIKMMRKKFTLMINSNENTAAKDFDDEIKDDEIDGNPTPVEDPRRLEEVILDLVTNLPSPPTNDPDEDTRSTTPEKSMSPSHRITIIPPNKERIVSAIEKIYDVIKTFDKDQDVSIVEEKSDVETENQTKSPIKHIQFSNTSQESTNIEFDSNNSKIFNFGKTSKSISSEANILIADETLNNESAIASPDFGYFENSSGEYSSISSIFSTIEPRFHATDSQMNNFSSGTLSEVSNYIEMLPEPSANNVSSGMKRPSDFEDEDVMYKKKITDGPIRLDEPTSGCDSPNLEIFFDEALLNSTIDSAINSLEPTLPELLSDIDVQEILQQIENDQQESN